MKIVHILSCNAHRTHQTTFTSHLKSDQRELENGRDGIPVGFVSDHKKGWLSSLEVTICMKMSLRNDAIQDRNEHVRCIA